MDANLIVVGGKASKRKITLNLPMVIGRGKEADLTIAHPMISRRHCRLFEQDGLLMVEDLGSLNGTLLGKVKIKQGPLPPDAELTIGPLTFKAEYKYEGDLSKLPAIVPAESSTPKASSQAASENEMPDFEPFGEPGDLAADEAFANIITEDTPVATTVQPPVAEKKKGWLSFGKKNKNAKENETKPTAGDNSKPAKAEKPAVAKTPPKPATPPAKGKTVATSKPQTPNPDDDLFDQFFDELT